LEQEEAINSLSPDEQRDLLDLSQNQKNPFKLASSKNGEDKAYFTLLEEKLEAQDSRLNAKYPELFKYFEYLAESKDLKPKEILKEQVLLENKIYSSLTSTEDEKKLYLAAKNLKAIKKLFLLKLTPSEYEVYKQRKNAFNLTSLTGFLNQKVMDLKKHYEKALFLEAGYEELIKKCETFYNLTYVRDQAFLRNTLNKMNQENQTEAVLITGGYHTPNLKELLKQQNISYVSITPQVFHETDHDRYERLLLAQNIPYDGRGAKGEGRDTVLAKTNSTKAGYCSCQD